MAQPDPMSEGEKAALYVVSSVMNLEVHFATFMNAPDVDDRMKSNMIKRIDAATSLHRNYDVNLVD